jgi:hypothetical protein
MVEMTHLDGADVVVIDARGQQVPAVDEVRLEPDRAVVAVFAGAGEWLQSLALSGPDATLACAIHARDGRLYWRGPVRLAYA